MATLKISEKTNLISKKAKLPAILQLFSKLALKKQPDSTGKDGTGSIE